MPFIRLHDATRIHYREHGAGSPLLLLHANPGDSRDFDAVFPALVTRHRVIAVDWPGYGQSSLPEYPERMTVCDFHRTLLGVIWLKKEKVAVWDSFKINSLQVFFV